MADSSKLIPNYDGSGCPLKFLDMAKKAIARQTTQADKDFLFDCVLSKLNGRAYDIGKKATTLSELRTKLLDRFTPSQSIEEIERKILNVTFLKDIESIEEYIQRVRGLGEQLEELLITALNLTPEVAQSLCDYKIKRNFIAGLEDQIRLSMNSLDHKNFEDAAIDARRMIRLDEIQRHRNGAEVQTQTQQYSPPTTQLQYYEPNFQQLEDNNSHQNNDNNNSVHRGDIQVSDYGNNHINRYNNFGNDNNLNYYDETNSYRNYIQQPNTVCFEENKGIFACSNQYHYQPNNQRRSTLRHNFKPNFRQTNHNNQIYYSSPNHNYHKSQFIRYKNYQNNKSKHFSNFRNYGYSNQRSTGQRQTNFPVKTNNINMKTDDNVVVNMFIDSGAEVSLIKKSSLKSFSVINTEGIIGLNGISQANTVSTLGTCEINIKLKPDLSIKHEFHIVPDDFPIGNSGMLGNDFLQKYNAEINYGTNTIKFFLPNKQMVAYNMHTNSYSTEYEVHIRQKHSNCNTNLPIPVVQTKPMEVMTTDDLVVEGKDKVTKESNGKFNIVKVSAEEDIIYFVDSPVNTTAKGYTVQHIIYDTDLSIN